MIDKDFAQKIRKRGQYYGISESQQYIEVGAPKSTIIDKAKVLKGNLIVIGSHSKKGMARLLGSTVASIVNSSEIDVSVIYTKM